MIPFNQRWSISQAAALSTLLEASAPKVGNVHPQASFADMHFGHFVASAMATEQVFENAGQLSVGQLVLTAVQATQVVAGCNTNLGTILLLAPLAVAACRLDSPESEYSSGDLAGSSRFRPGQLSESVIATLGQLTQHDSQLVYQAIRAAQPGGLGSQESHDISHSAPADLISAMRQVAAIDAVARQYVNGFADIWTRLLPWLNAELIKCCCPLQAILWLQLHCLAWQPDGLIVRKCGIVSAQVVQTMAQEILTQRDDFPSQDTAAAIHRLDVYLRGDGHRRNPGTTADLIAATLFCRLLCGTDG